MALVAVAILAAICITVVCWIYCWRSKPRARPPLSRRPSLAAQEVMTAASLAPGDEVAKTRTSNVPLEATYGTAQPPAPPRKKPGPKRDPPPYTGPPVSYV